MNTFERFGINLTQSEQKMFLDKLGVSNTEASLDFLTDFICKVLSQIPFQNYKMIERGLGHIPNESDIKEDMLSFNGGTCATMNTFIAAVLYNVGFDVSLINGTMKNSNDHIAILLNLNNKFYTIDLGDGQPYFNPIPIDENIREVHPFRTFRTICDSKNVRIDFLINSNWETDVTLHILPKPYKHIYKTLEQHYLQKEFGPFWNGVRFALYPNKRIVALRDNTFIVQNEYNIEKIHINSKEHLNEIVALHMPQFKEHIIQCYNKFSFYDN
jgi:N-hydroxyarylamine O-acetyltransferase